MENERYRSPNADLSNGSEMVITGKFLSLLSVYARGVWFRIAKVIIVDLYLSICHFIVRQTLDNPIASACRLYGTDPTDVRQVGY